MAWYLIIDKATGQLKSEGSRLPEYDPNDIKKRDQPLADNLEVLTLQARPDWRLKKWDAITRALIDKPEKKGPRSGLELLKRLTVEDVETMLKSLGITDERLAELKKD